MKSPTLKIIVAALALAGGSALAQGYGPGSGPCWDEGFGSGGGYGPGMGYGSGMMGYGPGGGRGMGYGRGGWGPGAGANLTDEQRTKAAALQEQHREQNWKTMGELRKEQFKLDELYAAAKPDAKAIAEQEKKVDALREQMFKQRNDMRREMQALLGR
jgi:Spy/CpxP family protein refolding chaperone